MLKRRVTSLVKIEAKVTPHGLEIEASRLWFAMLVYHNRCVIYFGVLLRVLSTVALDKFVDSRTIQFIN